MKSRSVVIVDAVRSPIGTSMGALKKWHAVDLLAAVLQAAVERNGLDPAKIDRVIGGCATTVGEQALNVTRNAVLAAGWPEHISAHTVDAHAASGFVALEHAVAFIRSGLADMCVVTGVESTRVPEGASTGVASGKPYGPQMHRRYEEAGGLLPPGVVADRLAHRRGLTREELDAYALLSRGRAVEASEQSIHKAAITPLRADPKRPASVNQDQLLSPLTVSAQDLPPLFEADGLLTAATFTPPADGAVCVIVAAEGVVDRLHMGVIEGVITQGTSLLEGTSGADVVRSLIDPKALDRVEVREDTAVTPLALMRDLKIDPAKVNPNGGALATGDPVGAAALLTLTSLAHGLHQDTNGRGVAVVAGTGAISGAVVVNTQPT
jgi:acetyl-CoA acyltransferase